MAVHSRPVCFLSEFKFLCFQTALYDWHDGAVVRASASKSVDLGFISQIESCQKTLKNGIYNFPAWRLAQKGKCGEQAGKLGCCVLGEAINGMLPPLCGRQMGGVKQSTRHGGPV